MTHDTLPPMKTLVLCLGLGLALVLAGCHKDDPAGVGASTPSTAKGAGPEADDSLLQRSCRHYVELGAKLDGKEAAPEKLERCLATAERIRKDAAADDATFDRFLQCRLDATDLDGTLACMQIIVEAQAGAARKQFDAKLADSAAEAQAALARIRQHVEAGVITAETLARVEKDRAHAGMGRFVVVLDDAHALVEAKRVAPGTKLEIHIHAGLGADAPPLPPASELAADLVFTDASSGRRVARISPITGALLSIGPLAARTKGLMQWWAQDPAGQDVEIAIEPDPESPSFAAPEGVAQTYALLELGGVVDRPLLLFPDGRRVSVKQWLGR